MKLIDLFETRAVWSPWPVAVDGKVFDGHNKPISPLCEKKCGSSPRCSSQCVEDVENLCEYGMSFFVVEV